MHTAPRAPELRQALLERRRDEITGYHICRALAQDMSDPANREVSSPRMNTPKPPSTRSTRV